MNLNNTTLTEIEAKLEVLKVALEFLQLKESGKSQSQVIAKLVEKYPLDMISQALNEIELIAIAYPK